MTNDPWFVFTDAELRLSFDHATLERARRYAAEGRVSEMAVDREGSSAAAAVAGSGRSRYVTRIRAVQTPASGLRRVTGTCTCPVGFNCKHAAALALTLSDASPRATTGLPARASQPRVPEWQARLSAVIDAPPVPRRLRPLALQIDQPSRSARSPSGDSGQSRLRLRPLIEGQSGKWIKTGAGWREVASPYGLSEAVPEHRQALAQLYAAHNAGRATAYYYSAPDHLMISEAQPAMWPMLAQVLASGVALIDNRGQAVELSQDPVAVSFDLSRTADGDIAVRVVLSRSGEALEPDLVRTVGLPVHGVELPHGDGTLLAPLGSPMPAHLLSWWRRAEPLIVPPSDADTFLHDFAPSLQRQFPVGSSDGSLVIPEVVGPALGLDVRYGEPGQVLIEWTADYRIGDTLRSIPLHAESRQPWRDRDGEGLLRVDPPLPDGSLSVLAARVGSQDLVVPRQALQRLDAARFVNEWLPVLVADPRVAVREHGERPDLRLLEEAPEVRLATSAVAGDRDWFDLEVEVSIAGERIVLADLLVALTSGETHLFLDSGGYFSLDRPELDQLRKLLAEAAALQDRPGRPTLRISRFQADLWAELVELGVVSAQSAAWEESVRALAGLEEIPEPDLPGDFEAELRPYQRDGYRWLSFLWDHDLGGILADDMGLGKTVQTLALVARAAERGELTAPVLVVAPASVVHNWAVEARRFAPKLRVVTIGETTARRGESLADAVAGAAIVVTSYTLFRLAYDEFSASSWRALVLDEAQAVKNPKSKAYQCTRRLDVPFKLAITGTPLENNLMDLWSQLSIVAPGLFPNPDRFTEHFRHPIEKEQDAERLAVLRRRIRPLMLRRTKELVASDLPPRQEQVLEVELHDRHRRIYDRQLQRERQKVLGLVDDLDKNRFAIFRSLTLLRQLSLHAGLVDPAHAAVPSAKVGALLEQLEDVVAEGHRVLVFSQFTSFLAMVRDALDAQGIGYTYLDGRTRNRQRVVDEFRSGRAPVFLISLKAGGVGLNLTEADYVFVLDPWWNPAVEAQAVDRAHRIGQQRTVMVYRLVATGTIEEKVMALKERKAKLFDQVVGGDALESGALTAADIRGLFEA